MSSNRSDKITSENYYDVLKVRQDCSSKEIRDAFVELSKKFHPDVKGAQDNSKQTARFVQISQAYQTLIKPSLRYAYDQDLYAQRNSSTSASTDWQRNSGIYRSWEIKPDFNPNPSSYYGVKGVNKISNFKIAGALLVVGIIGAIFGFTSVKQSYNLSQMQLDEVSAKAGTHHAHVRANAQKFGNSEQLRRMVDRMLKNDER